GFKGIFLQILQDSPGSRRQPSLEHIRLGWIGDARADMQCEVAGAALGARQDTIGACLLPVRMSSRWSLALRPLYRWPAAARRRATPLGSPTPAVRTGRNTPRSIRSVARTWSSSM